MHTAVAVVGGVCPSHGAVGELRGRVRENRVPPLEKARGIASGRHWVVSSTWQADTTETM